jgi:GNAT superfamily N-acetyltransferase
MTLSAELTTLSEIQPWRDLYRQEMHCQVICDSLHPRPGWCQEYWLLAGGERVGYGSLVLGGPWKDKPTLFEFYVLPQRRGQMFALFETLLAATGASLLHGQSNDPLFTSMLLTYATEITVEAILYYDKLTTTLAPPGALFRAATAEDAARSTPEREISEGEWLIECEGEIAANGGILYHYNRPYGDIYMGVAEPFRRRGLGSLLVQELKRVCYERGSVPAARCNARNLASRRTLQKAGFVPCGNMLDGKIGAPLGKDS